MSDNRREFWLIGISFFIVYVVWGSTYLANAWGVDSVPPFMFAGARFVLAALVLYPFSRVVKGKKVTRLQVKNTAIAGFWLFAIGNGLVVWALQYVETGFTSLLIACQPLIVVFLMWLMRNQPPSGHSWFGVGIGIIGMYLLTGQPAIMSSTEWKLGVLAVFIALLAWGYCLVWMKDADLPASIFQSSALQMFFGGMMMFVISFALGEHHRFDYQSVTPKAFWGLIYLIIFGSVVAFTAFNYLVKKVSPDKVSTSTFVNPIIALILGSWLNYEVISAQSIVAAILLLTGVLFVNGQVRMAMKWVRHRNR